MCRLLGIRAEGPVDVGDLLSRFRPLAKEHAHGWGFAWYERSEVYLHKEALAATESATFPDLAGRLRSPLVLAHLRRATHGAVREVNSHPFRRGAWTFAHNGTVDRDLILRLADLETSELEGDTDTEAFFLWLRRCIAKENGDVPAGLARAVAPLGPDHYQAVNFLMSDGQTFYAYRDPSVRHDAYSLFVAERLDEWGLRTLVVSSEKLTGDADDWRPLGLGELLVAEAGGRSRREQIR